MILYHIISYYIILYYIILYYIILYYITLYYIILYYIILYYKTYQFRTINLSCFTITNIRRRSISFQAFSTLNCMITLSCCTKKLWLLKVQKSLDKLRFRVAKELDHHCYLFSSQVLLTTKYNCNQYCHHEMKPPCLIINTILIYFTPAFFCNFKTTDMLWQQFPICKLGNKTTSFDSESLWMENQ